MEEMQGKPGLRRLNRASGRGRRLVRHIFVTQLNSLRFCKGIHYSIQSA